MVARSGVRARGGVRRAGGNRHRPFRPDARAGGARPLGRGDPTGDSLERPADRGGVRGDRATRRARAPDRADGQPGLDRVHGAQAPVAAPSRTRRVRAHPAGAAAEGLRPAQAHRRMGNRRVRRIGDAPPRRRTARLERRRPRCARPPARVASSRVRVARPRRGDDGERHRAARDLGCGRRRRPARRSAGRGRRPAGALSVVLGTSGVVLAALPAYAHDREARVHAFCHAVPQTWQAMGVMLSAAGSLQWLHDVVAPEVPFEKLGAEAEEWPPGVDGLLFAPYLAGERTPYADPDARGAFVGLELRHDRGALVRAVLEGVAFGLRDSLELLRELGVDAHVARVSGGGSRSALWRRIVASVLGVPLESTASSEGSALGAAMLGGVAAGVFADTSDAVARCVRTDEPTEPDPAWADVYDAAYGRFRLLYPATKGVIG